MKKFFASLSLLFGAFTFAQVQPVIPPYNFYGNNSASYEAPSAFLTEKYYVQTPVTSATIAAAEAQACANGGGIVMIPAGIYQAVSNGGTISGPFPLCTTASVIYSGSAYAAGGSGTFNYGTTFILDKTFGLFQYNNTCTLTTCTPLSISAFSAGYLNGAGLMDMTIEDGLDSVMVGSPYAPGCNGCVFRNLNIVNDADSGLQAENFWGETRFENIKASGSYNYQMIFCGSSGSNFQPGNSLATNLDAASASNIQSGAIQVCARGTNGALNNFMLDAAIDEIENHTATQSAVTVTIPATATVTPTAGTTLLPVGGNVFQNNTAIAFATATGGLTAGQVYYTTGVTCQGSGCTFSVTSQEFGGAITLSCTSYTNGICPTSAVTQAATATNGSSAFSMVGQPFKSNQPVIATQNVGTCGSVACIIAGNTYYIYGAFGSSFTLINTIGSTTPIVIEGCAASPAPVCGAYFYSNALYVPNYIDYPNNAEVTFNGTLTNTNLTVSTTYFTILSQQAAGNNGFVSISQYPGGTPYLVPTMAGAVSGLNIKNWGPSALQVWGYGQPNTTGAATVVESTFTRLDLEVNGGSENAALSVAQNRDTTFTSGGFFTSGSNSTLVLRHNSNTVVPLIADAFMSIDTLPGDIPNWISGARSVPGPGPNGSNNVGIGLSQVNAARAGNFARSGGGMGILYLSALASYDMGFNPAGDFVDFPNFAIGFQNHSFTSGTTLVPGNLTSSTSVNCIATGCNITLPTIASNVNTEGSGLFTILHNVGTFPLTVYTAGEGIEDTASTSTSLAANSSAVLQTYPDTESFTGYIVPATCGTSPNTYSCGTLTVCTAPPVIMPGQLLGPTGTVSSGTLVSSGSGSTWTVSISQTVGSGTCTGAPTLTTTANYWSFTASGSGGGGSGVTSVSVANANGFSGTSSGGTTPTLTLSPTWTGVGYSNGSVVSAATSSTSFPGNSATATAFANAPSQCGTNTVSTGVNASGNANCTAIGSFATQNYQTPPAIGGTTPAAGSFTSLSATGTLTTNVTGTTQCLHANSSGVISGTGNDCGTSSGGVTSVSVATANGFSGTSSGGSTPAITLDTTFTGVAYSNGSQLAAATSSNSFPGNAATSTAFANAPTTCGTGQATTGIAANGNAQGCFTPSSGVTTTGSPANGNLAKFSGASTITNGNLSGDVTTSGTLTATVVGINGQSLAALATGLVVNTTSTGVPVIATIGGGLGLTNDTLFAYYVPRQVTGTTDTILSSDCGYGVEYTSSSSVAVTLPQATGSFATCNVDIIANGSGTVTVTPNTSTINGSSSLAVPGSRSANISVVSGNYIAAGTAVDPAINLGCTSGAGCVTGTLSASNLPAALSSSTSINGTTVAASAGTAAGSTGSFTVGDCLKVGSTSPLEIADNGSGCNTGGSSGANPTATIGLTAVNGSATTFLRSDGSPALSQAITPTWTGLHKYTNGDFSILGTGTGYTLLESGLSSTSNNTLTLPTTTTDTLAAVGTAETWTALQKVTNGDFSLLGTGTGYTLLESGLTSTSNNTITLPTTSSDTLAGLATTQSFTGSDTFNSGNLLVKGSSTGTTAVASGNASSTNYTITFPANTGTAAELNFAQTFTAAQTFANSGLILLGSSTGSTTLTSANSSTTNYTLTVPAVTATLTVTIASGSTAMPTTSVSANSCSSSATTATATGAAASDGLIVNYSGDPTGVTGYGGGTNGGITIRPWLTSNTVNFKLCNETGSPISPSALTAYWRITR